MTEGLVTKKITNLFEVETRSCVLTVSSRGNLKADGVFVGDKVVVSSENIIEKVLPRKNILVRPPLANLDRMIIVVSSVPMYDPLLLDKLLIFCALNGIQPIICINKTDLTSLDDVKEVYGKFYKVIKASAVLSETSEVVKEIKGITAFAGQSAVGKSSIINAIFGNEIAGVGELSKKIERGKQTTRVSQLYKVNKGYIADTAGFSMLDEGLFNIEANELKNHYPDFEKATKDCRFGNSCLHDKEQNCGVKKAVECGIINEERYNRYIRLLNSLQSRKKY